MLRFIVRRIIFAIISLFIIVSATFFLMKAVPGDPISNENEDIPAEILESMRDHYGLNDPLPVQYVNYLVSVVKWDLGPSYTYKGTTVNEIIRSGFPVSLSLGLVALFLGISGGLFLGVVSALNHNRSKDNNPEEAKKLLEEGMEELGITELPEVTFLYSTSDRNHRVAQTLQAQISDSIGIDIELEHKEAKVFFEQQNEGDHMFSIAGRSGSFNDPINFLQNYMIKDSTSNNTNWHNPKYNEFLEQARVESDTEKRNQLLYNAEEVMMDDMPLTPLFSGTTSWMSADKVKGVPMSSTGHIDLKYGYIEE